MGRTPTIANRRTSRPELAPRLTLGLFTLLAGLQAVVLVATGRTGHFVVGVAVLAASILAGSLMRPGPPRLATLASLGIVGFTNFALHFSSLAEPTWRVASLAVLVGYAFTLTALALGVLLRRELAAPLLSATMLWIGVVGLEAVLESRTEAAPPLNRVRWVGAMTAHATMGLVYAPRSTVRSLYGDNPGGYFRETDRRARMWKLKVNHPTSAARLELPADRPDTLRVAMDLPGQPTAWHVQLAQEGLHLAARRSYRLTFRVRADQPRTIEYGVTQAHPPWNGLGYYRTRDVDATWRDVVEAFELRAGDENAAFSFNLGGHPASVEFADVQMRDVSTGESLDEAPPPEYFVEYRFNAEGCRGPDYDSPKPPDRRRVLLLGDSYALGAGVHESDTAGAQLEALLGARQASRASAVRYDVVNCGVSGFSTREARLMFEAVAPRYEPDVVVLAMVHDDDRSRRDEEQRASAESGGFEQLLRLWTLVRSPRDAGPSGRDFTSSVAEVRTLDTLTRQRGGRLVVAAFRNGPLEAGWKDLLEQMSAGLSGTGIEIVDLGVGMNADSAWRDLVVHQAIDRHPNQSAHRLAAQQLIDVLEKRRLLVQ